MKKKVWKPNKGQEANLTWQRFLIYSTLCLLAFLFFGSFFSLTDYCFVDRFSLEFKNENGGFWASPTLSHFVFNLTLLLLLFLFFQLIFWKSKKTFSNDNDSWKVNWSSSYATGITIFWYGATYLLCHGLKVLLRDSTCSEHSNSVSGHYCFHIFYMISTIFLIVQLERDPQNMDNYFGILWQDFQCVRSASKRIILTYCLFVLCSVFTLSRTWIYGYHSLRQIAYGIILALCSNAALALTFSPRLYRYSLFIAFVYALVSFAIYPLFLSGFTSLPLSYFEILFFLGALFLAFRSSINIAEIQKKLQNRHS